MHIVSNSCVSLNITLGKNLNRELLFPLRQLPFKGIEQNALEIFEFLELMMLVSTDTTSRKHTQKQSTKKKVDIQIIVQWYNNGKSKNICLTGHCVAHEIEEEVINAVESCVVAQISDFTRFYQEIA